MRRTSIRLLQLPTKSNASPFEIFSLPSTATSKEIKARYYELVKIYHPDRCTTGDQQKHTKDFQAIVRAYELLSDTKKRQQYVDTGIGWTSDGAQSKWDADMEFIRRNYGHRRSTQFAGSYTPPYSRRSGGWDGEFYWSTYHHPSTGRHKPVYSSNGAFISGLIFFVSVLAEYLLPPITHEIVSYCHYRRIPNILPYDND